MFTVIRQWIIDTLGFSRSEANGTLILIVLLLLVAIFPRFYLYNTGAAPDGFTPDSVELKKWIAALDAVSQKEPDPLQVVAVHQPKVKSFSFDPNTVTHSELLELGFSKRAASNLIGYREKGGRFMIKNDLKKVYNISEERVDALWGYINLPEFHQPKAPVTPVPEVADRKFEEENKLVQIDINQAGAEDLQQIRGIGSKLSTRIIKFRDLLGGFYSASQLSEVYGLSPEVVEKLTETCIISGKLNKVNINADSAVHLYKHPYIDYNMAYAIINYRKQHGNYKSVEDLKRIKIIDDSLYEKIYPYLSINQ